jgi:hypothetical protein
VRNGVPELEHQDTGLRRWSKGVKSILVCDFNTSGAGFVGSEEWWQSDCIDGREEQKKCGYHGRQAMSRQHGQIMMFIKMQKNSEKWSA